MFAVDARSLWFNARMALVLITSVVSLVTCGSSLSGTTIKVAYARGCPTNVVDQRAYPTGQDPKAAMQVAVD
jgi:hypothetical protein